MVLSSDPRTGMNSFDYSTTVHTQLMYPVCKTLPDFQNSNYPHSPSVDLGIGTTFW